MCASSKVKTLLSHKTTFTLAQFHHVEVKHTQEVTKCQLLA